MQERWKPAVTVAAVIERDGRYLLVEEQQPEGLMLNNPAGHLEPGETPEEGVVREALEETAYPFTPTELVGVYLSTTPGTRAPVEPGAGRGSDEGAGHGDRSYLRLAFCGTVGEPEAGRALDQGIVRAVWMTPGEIRDTVARHRSPMVLRCIEDHLAGRRFPLDLIYTDPPHLQGRKP